MLITPDDLVLIGKWLDACMNIHTRNLDRAEENDEYYARLPKIVGKPDSEGPFGELLHEMTGSDPVWYSYTHGESDQSWMVALLQGDEGLLDIWAQHSESPRIFMA